MGDQVVVFEGQQHHFPDDFTDADIAKALKSIAPPAPPQVYHSDLRKVPLVGNILGSIDENIAEPAIQQGAKGMLSIIGHNPPAEGESRTSQVLGGVSDVGRGVMTAVGVPLALSNPIGAAKAVAGGLVGEGLGRVGSAVADFGPGTSQFVGDLGGMAGGYAGTKIPTPSPLTILKAIRHPWQTGLQSIAGAIADHLYPPEPPDSWGKFHAPSGYLPKPSQEVDPWGNFTPPSGMLPKPQQALDPWGQFTPPGGLLPKPIEMTDKFGKFTPQPIAKAPTPKAGAVEPPTPVAENPVMQPLQPIDKFEMNRMAHARAQELELPGSPAGKSGHAQLSKTAKETFGVKSWSDLTPSEMRKIHDFMDANKRLPLKGEIKE